MSKTNRLVTTEIARNTSFASWFADKDNKGITVSYTPFGSPPPAAETTGPSGHLKPGLYVKKAVDWKGESLEFIDRNFPGVGRGLRRAIQISQSASGVRGTAVLGGVVVPAKDVVERRNAGRGASVGSRLERAGLVAA